MDNVEMEKPYIAILGMGMVWGRFQLLMIEVWIVMRRSTGNVFSTVLNWHPNVKTIICVISTKDDERSLRLKGMRHIPNEHL